MKDEGDVVLAQAGKSAGPQPGEHYRHWKGGEYVVVARSVKEDTLEQLVTYRSLEFGHVWTRTLDDFLEPINGVRRFVRIIPKGGA